MGVLVMVALALVVVVILGVVLRRRGVTNDLTAGRDQLHSARTDTKHLSWGQLPTGEQERPR